jgi:glycosyltransferase involved in cell wall biosynthesis
MRFARQAPPRSIQSRSASVGRLQAHPSTYRKGPPVPQPVPDPTRHRWHTDAPMDRSSLRLAVVLPDLALGGSEVVAINIANTLHQRGDRVTVVVLGHDGDLRERIAKDIPVLLLGSRRARTAIRTLRRALRNGAFDCVATFHVQTTVVAALATYRSGIPVHASEHSLVLDQQTTGSIVDVLRREAQRRAYRHAKGVYVPSEEAAQQVEQLTRRRVRPLVLPNPILASTVSSQSGLHPWLLRPRHARVVVVVGRLAPEKRLHVAAEIVEEARRRLGDVRLLLIGPYAGGWDSALLARPWIKAVGPVPDPGGWIAAADVLLITSESESFGNVVIEAAAVRTPVVAVGTAGAPEMLLRSLGGGIHLSHVDVEAAVVALERGFAGDLPEVRRGELDRFDMIAATEAFRRNLAAR